MQLYFIEKYFILFCIFTLLDTTEQSKMLVNGAVSIENVCVCISIYLSHTHTLFFPPFNKLKSLSVMFCLDTRTLLK